MPDLSIFKLDSQTITIKDTTARQTAESAKTLATAAATAGNAVREQFTELKNDLDENVSDLKSALKILGNDGLIEIEKVVTWQFAWINTSGIVNNSTASKIALIPLRKGETVVVGTKNANIAIISSTTNDTVNIGDTVSVIRTTDAQDVFKTYKYTATDDINIVVCVRASEYSLHFFEQADVLTELNDKLSGILSKNLIGNVGGVPYPVEFVEDTTITMSTSDGSNIQSETYLVYLDANYNMLGYFRFYNGVASRTVTIPSTTKYLMWVKTYQVPLQVEIGNQSTGYQEYIPTLLEVCKTTEQNEAEIKSGYNSEQPYLNSRIYPDSISNGLDNTALRTKELEVKKGNRIAIDPGSLKYKIGIWNGSVSSSTKVIYTEEWQTNQGEYPVENDGIACVMFAKLANTDNISFSDYDGSVTWYNNDFKNETSSYTDDDIESTCAEYSAILKNIGKAETFMFVTDEHLMGNENYFTGTNLAKVQLLMDNMNKYYSCLPLNFILDGGDWLNNKDYKVIAMEKLGYVDALFRSKFGENARRPMVGNHDNNEQGYEDAQNMTTGSGLLTNDQLRFAWFSRWEHNYYSFKGMNSTFYILDTGTDKSISMTNYRWEQVDWLGKKLENESSAHVIVAMHIVYNAQISDGILGELAENAIKILQAYNARTSITLNGIVYDFTSSTGKVACVLAGHCHEDADTVIYDIPVIFTPKAYLDIGNGGTFDLCIIDYDSVNPKAHMIRVGNGNSRNIDIIV